MNKALCNLCATTVQITKAEALRCHGPHSKPCTYSGKPVATHGTPLCWQCDIRHGKTAHTCPFQSDVHNNDDFTCNCCEKCTDDCAQSI
jgi:hypothetical protein